MPKPLLPPMNATVYNWTAMGMRTTGGIGEYIEKREAEQLLARVFEAGRKRGLEQAVAVLNKKEG